MTVNCCDLKSMVTNKDNEIWELRRALRTRKASVTSPATAGGRRPFQTSRDDETASIEDGDGAEASRKRIPSNATR